MTVISSLVFSEPLWTFSSYFTTGNYSGLCSTHFLTLDQLAGVFSLQKQYTSLLCMDYFRDIYLSLSLFYFVN